MKVFYKGRTHRTDAIGEFDPVTRKLIVKKGSIVSESVAEFKEAEIVKKIRQENVDADGRLVTDLEFKAPSSAAAFVTGYCANGLLTWHLEKHKTLRDYLKKKQGECGRKSQRGTIAPDPNPGNDTVSSGSGTRAFP